MFDHLFWHYSGLAFWTIICVYIMLRLILGKSWLIKIGLISLLGPGLKQSFLKLFSEYPNNIKKDTLADVATHLVWRFTRLGLLGLIIAGLPVWLLLQQNSILKAQNELFSLQNQKVDSQLVLFSHQNKRIDEQTTLLEKQTSLFKDQNIKIDSQIDLTSLQATIARDELKFNRSKILSDNTSILLTATDQAIGSLMELNISYVNYLNFKKAFETRAVSKLELETTALDVAIKIGKVNSYLSEVQTYSKSSDSKLAKLRARLYEMFPTNLSDLSEKPLDHSLLVDSLIVQLKAIHTTIKRE